MWVCHLSAPCLGRRSQRRKASLKPYWGKPGVRNFRGGEGNVSRVWRLFATPPERADTTEADRPKLGAPSLYSATWRDHLLRLLTMRVMSSLIRATWKLISKPRRLSATQVCQKL